MEKKFHFTQPFLESFKETINLLSEQLDKLNTLEKGFTNEMGVYNCSYKMRYITPSDIAEYISNIHKGMRNDLISSNPCDLEMFASEFVRRTMEKHECEPFNAPGLMGNNFIDTKNTGLQDMLVIHANAVYNRIVRAPYEQKENYEELKKGDLKVINDMHYAANMKKIIDGMPDMIESMDGAEIYKHSPLIGKAFRAAIEEFIMFATTLNAITVSSMVAFSIPTATFATKAVKPEEEDSNVEKDAFSEYVTECCFLKTNTMSIENRIPFNCNMRNVVLQDTSAVFNDTRNAVKFIINDSRSPIHELLVKYATIGRGEYGAEMIKQAFLTHRHGYNGRPLQSEVQRRMEERTSFHTDDGWFDKIVYGSQLLDSNYREDNPGNHHEHSIAYDMRTIYKMFSCHHNDNEHLANNVVKVGNIICGLVEGYSYNQYEVFRDNLRDVLAVLAEIMTKDMLSLYHNNHKVLIYRDDMNDTMIPGYMYCEAFVMEAENAPNAGGQATTTTANANQQQGNKTVVHNNTQGMNQSTTMQKVKDKILEIIRKFGEYIRNTINQIFPKFNAGHAAEIKWVEAHKQLNEEIAQALDGQLKDKDGNPKPKFSITVDNYPDYSLPVKPIEELKNSVNQLLTSNFNSRENAQKWLDDPKNNGVEGFKKALLFPDVAKQNPQSAQDIQNMTHDFLLYGGREGGKPAQQGATELDGKKFKSLTENLGKNIVDAMKVYTTDIGDIMTKLADSIKKIAEEEKKLTEANEKAAQNNQQQTQFKPVAEQLFNVVTEVTKACYVPAMSTLSKEFYGNSYNCYRDIVAEYQRMQTNGVDMNANQKQAEQQNATEPKPESAEDITGTGKTDTAEAKQG